ncbi:alpha-glucosidase C-terminal domain-containing protein [bacterium]|nr:alpha-glucosidase C-terminal domain-containing protein [bacterium]
MKKRAFFLLFILLITGNYTYAKENNDLRTLFLNNEARICGINIRNFNAKDINGNEIIDNGEESGNFINAIERLDEIKNLGVNTLHLLPITPVGKLKALGTAGSLYAISSFSDINPQLADKNSDLTPKEQAKQFINECHKRKIRVIVDLPSCGAYDLFLTNPELFIKDDKQCSIVPSDWTDVRLLNTGNNMNLNQDVMNAHKRFVNMIQELGADGIRADVATIKPSKFWVELIKYARENDPEFMFLAEASDSWREPPSKYAEFTPYNELLEAGFDGYYGSFFNLKDWNAKEFTDHIKFNQKLLSSYPDKKSVIMSFTTHDEVSPVVLHGAKFSIMISWLEATLPFNPYCIDGFFNGDNYIYQWANTEAGKTYTDDDTYFVHRGKLDIFNFSKKPGGNNLDVVRNFKQANDFRINNTDLVTKGDFIPIKTKDKKVFAFSRTLGNETIIVAGNLDFNKSKDKITVKTSKIKKNAIIDIEHGNHYVKTGRNHITMNFKPGEIIVIKVEE